MEDVFEEYTEEEEPTIVYSEEEEIMVFEEPEFLEEPETTPEVSEVQEEKTPEPEKEKSPAISIITPNQPAEIKDDVVLPERLYSPNNIIFLIDISSSMKKSDKLPLLKTSMTNLTKALRKVDRISVITYSITSDVLMPSTTADNKNEIFKMIDSLSTRGYTNGVKGLQTAYEIAEQNFISGGNNQIILATDGLFNNPGYSEDELFSMVKEKTKDDIILSVIGFGQDNDALRLMKRLSSKGSGSFIQIPDKQAADEILINEIKLQSAINQ